MAIVPTGGLDLRTAGDLSETKALVDTLASHLLEIGSPMVAQALREEAKGTLVTLAQNGALVTRDVDRHLECDHQGDHHQKAWDDYLGRIKQELHKEFVGLEACLAQAMDELALHIHRAHWLKFGFYLDKEQKEWIGTWPKPKDSNNTGYQESPISIRLDLKYKWNEDLVIVSMGGDVMVSDSRPEPTVFIARVKGKPTIKYLTLKAKQIPALEREAKLHGAAAFLQGVITNGQQYKKLTLEDLKMKKS